MARNIDPRCKQCRRIDEKLFLKGERCDSPKCALVKRKYPPGMHGPKQRIRLSNYGVQLREKQKAKKIYGILETQFANYIGKATKMPGDAGNNLLGLLERRLDNVLFRAGFGYSRNASRQIVSHGLIKVNNKRVDTPSYCVNSGDRISIAKEKFQAQQTQIIEKSGKKNRESLPSWLTFDPVAMIIQMATAPDPSDLPKNINTRLIVEYYSR